MMPLFECGGKTRFIKVITDHGLMVSYSWVTTKNPKQTFLYLERAYAYKNPTSCSVGFVDAE